MYLVQILSTLGFGNPNLPSFVPNLKRRTGNAGLNDDQILPSSLTARAMFGFPDPSDVTDDDASQINTLVHKKKEDDLKNALPLSELRKASDIKPESNSRTSGKIQGDIGCDTNEAGGRNSKSSIQHQVHKNGGRSRDSSLDSSSISPDRKSGSKGYDRNGEGGRKRNSRKSKEKLSVEDPDNRTKLINSQELNLGGTLETKTHQGKIYTKVKSDCPGNVSCSDDNSSASDDEQERCDVNSALKTKKNSLRNSAEVRKTPDHSTSLKEGSKLDEDTSDASSSCSHEISRLGIKSSLSGISTGASKHVPVSLLRQAREVATVATQTSLSSGLNEIGTIENDRQKFIMESQPSHQSISDTLRSDNIYNDISNNHSHKKSFQDKETKVGRSKSSEMDRRKSSTELVRNPNA